MRNLGIALFKKMAKQAVTNVFVRHHLISLLSVWMKRELLNLNKDNRPKQVQKEKLALGMALLESIKIAFKKGHLSTKIASGLILNLLGNVVYWGAKKRKEFICQYGRRPPLFLVISPAKACNLKCPGCYAASGSHPEKLPFEIFDRIISEAKNFFDMRFFVISGGEPLLWQDQNKTILDIAEKHDDCFFLMYTNGLLITKKVVQKIAQLGNLTPAVSIEGFEKETDARRGEGVFKKILYVMEHLKNGGIPFGISVTATKTNAKLITSDEFFDYYFEKLGVIYCWIFQYMPIGRGFTLDLMITPKQQIEMNHKIWKQVQTKKRFIVDFWNSGTASDGCICAAREGGYFYIDWNGDVMPCVFIPYSTHNIIKVYQQGGDLKTVSLESPFFKELNDWQNKHGYDPNSMSPDRIYKLQKYFPCPIRHHYMDFRKIAETYSAKPIDLEAEKAWADGKYTQGLDTYGNKIKNLVGY